MVGRVPGAGGVAPLLPVEPPLLVARFRGGGPPAAADAPVVGVPGVTGRMTGVPGVTGFAPAATPTPACAAPDDAAGGGAVGLPTAFTPLNEFKPSAAAAPAPFTDPKPDAAPPAAAEALGPFTEPNPDPPAAPGGNFGVAGSATPPIDIPPRCDPKPVAPAAPTTPGLGVTGSLGVFGTPAIVKVALRLFDSSSFFRASAKSFCSIADF